MLFVIMLIPVSAYGFFSTKYHFSPSFQKSKDILKLKYICRMCVEHRDPGSINIQGCSDIKESHCLGLRFYRTNSLILFCSLKQWSFRTDFKEDFKEEIGKKKLLCKSLQPLNHCERDKLSRIYPIHGLDRRILMELFTDWK